MSVNKDMVALVERVRDGFAEAVEGHDAVSLDFRLPLVVRVLPRLQRGDGQDGKARRIKEFLRLAIPRLMRQSKFVFVMCAPLPDILSGPSHLWCHAQIQSHNQCTFS